MSLEDDQVLNFEITAGGSVPDELFFWTTVTFDGVTREIKVQLNPNDFKNPNIAGKLIEHKVYISGVERG